MGKEKRLRAERLIQRLADENKGKIIDGFLEVILKYDKKDRKKIAKYIIKGQPVDQPTGKVKATSKVLFRIFSKNNP